MASRDRIPPRPGAVGRGGCVMAGTFHRGSNLKVSRSGRAVYAPLTSARFNSQVLVQAYFCGCEIHGRFINACRRSFESFTQQRVLQSAGGEDKSLKADSIQLVFHFISLNAGFIAPALSGFEGLTRYFTELHLVT